MLRLLSLFISVAILRGRVYAKVAIKKENSKRYNYRNVYMKLISLAVRDFSPKPREDTIKIAEFSLKDVLFAKILALVLIRN